MATEIPENIPNSRGSFSDFPTWSKEKSTNLVSAFSGRLTSEVHFETFAVEQSDLGIVENEISLN